MRMNKSCAEPAAGDQWKRLVASMWLQAIRDLHDPDQLAALDALCWFVDGDADEYLRVLDIAPRS